MDNENELAAEQTNNMLQYSDLPLESPRAYHSLGARGHRLLELIASTLSLHLRPSPWL